MIGRPPRLSRAPPHPHFFRFPETHLTIGPRRNHRPCSSDSHSPSTSSPPGRPTPSQPQTCEPPRRLIPRPSPIAPRGCWRRTPVSGDGGYRGQRRAERSSDRKQWIRAPDARPANLGSTHGAGLEPLSRLFDSMPLVTGVSLPRPSAPRLMTRATAAPRAR